VGLLLHVVTSARVQPANEFIVCALTRTKRHVYDKLKQHTASVRRATRPWLRPYVRIEFFLTRVFPHCIGSGTHTQSAAAAATCRGERKTAGAPSKADNIGGLGWLVYLLSGERPPVIAPHINGRQ
jgi:hypothetical protein